MGEAVLSERPEDPLVLGLPRGGVPVAHEVALALNAPLDVLIVRKVGLPGQPELAMGAVAEDDVIIKNEDVLRIGGVSNQTFDIGAELAREELARRVQSYRDGGSPKSFADRTAIVVDDGLATGSTAKAAVAVCREGKARAVWVAVPVAPRDTRAEFVALTDRYIVLHEPRAFFAVGAWYDDFTQTSDSEVRAFLAG